jgi:diguanylate cyclase (GGDEF)-like protein
VERSRLADRLPSAPEPEGTGEPEPASSTGTKEAGRAPGLIVASAVFLFVFFLFCQVAPLGGVAYRTLVENTIFVLANVLAVGAALVAMHRCRADRRRYRSWAFVAVAVAAYLVGHLLQGYQELVRQLPDSPDAMDGLFYVCLFVGLLGFAATRQNRVRRWQFTLDTVTITLGGGAVLWYFVAGPLATGGGHSTHTVVDALFFPLGDLVLLVAGLRILQRGVPSSSKRSVRTIALGIMVYVLADIWSGYISVHSTSNTVNVRAIDVMVMAATTLFAIAGARQPTLALPEGLTSTGQRGSSWITYTCAASVFALVFVVQRHDPFFPNLSIAGVAVVIALLVATSQLLGQRALVVERTKNEQLLEDLRHQAFHDDLTGLPNRALFSERLEHALTRRRSLSTNHAVLMVDLDGFKSVNDTMGHKAGDELIGTMAERLGRAVRRGDTVARVGGHEFALLLEDVSSETDAVELVQHLLETVRKPTIVSGRTLIPGASVGIALTEEEPRSADELLRFADAAMYLAKGEHQSHYCVFETAMQTALAERADLGAELPGATGRGELRVFYQPILHLASEDVIGFEALVRWMHPSRGLLQPAAFLPLAERGLIHEIDTWVLFEATAEASRWHHLGPEYTELSVQVNLSPTLLHEPDLIDTVADALSAAGLDAHLLTLELVESSVVDDLEHAKARLDELKELGVRIAVDDFGTGFSSLSHLQSLPIDELKIDRSFVAGMENSVQASTVVLSLIQLGAALGMDTVAEGIEDTEQLERLRDQGCLLGQGYLFARPLASDDVRTFLRDRRCGSIHSARHGNLNLTAAAVPS